MDKKVDFIKKALQESINNYPSYKINFQNIFSLLKENIKYEKILNYYNPEKDEKNLKLFYLFFLKHHKWINPHDINIYLFQDHFKIKKSVYNDNLEEQVVNGVDPQKMIKIFVYWYFYLLMNFENNLIENDNVINNDEIKKILVFTEIKNILLQTNNKIINFYEIKKINIKEVFIFLYTYIFWIEYYTKMTSNEKELKAINTILFELLFDTLQKISLKILTEIESIDQFKDNIKIFYSFLDELKVNALIHNDYNIIILLDSNIIQTFVENILINIRPKLLEGFFPNYSDNLADFYSSFVKFRFNKSKIMDFLINNVKNSLVNLRYFFEEKEKIVNDILIQKFQSDLIQKIFSQESFKNSEHPNFHSFLFNGKNSKMSFKLGKLSLNDNLIIFSFHIKPHTTNNNLSNISQPLVCFNNYKNDLIFKLSLNEIDSNKKSFQLKIVLNNNKKLEKILKECDIIESNKTYYICIYLNNSRIQVNLISSTQNNHKSMELIGDYKTITKEEGLILNIGYDDSNEQKEYFSGYISNFYIIKLFNNKNKIDNENKNSIIEKILQLKEYYRYIIFYLNIKNDSENKAEYNLDYISFYKNKSEISKEFKNLENIKKQSKNSYEIILCLSPEQLKFLMINKNININKYNVPKISGICEKQEKYFFNDINITFVKYDYSKEIFLMKNGLNYFCLQFEYFYQFANYYMFNFEKEKNKEIEKENEKSNEIIFYEKNTDYCMKLIKSSINNILLLLIKFIIDLNIINFSDVLKQIFTTLFAAMKSLNNITTIIDPIIHQLSSIIVIIDEQIKESSYQLSKSKSISNNSFNDNNTKFFISFRDGVIDFLLTNELYINTSTQFKELLFEKIMSIIENNDKKDIISTYPNIFLKILSFTQILSEFFIDFDPKTDIKSSKGKNSILYSYLKLIKGVIIRKKKNLNEDIFFKQLFIFALRDYRHNQYVNYMFLTIINDLLKEGYSLEDDEIMELINYFIEVMKNKEVNLDNNNENNEESQEKFKNNLCSLILTILLSCIFEKNIKQNLTTFCNEIKKIELNDYILIKIIREIINIFGRTFDSNKMLVIKNMDNKNNDKATKKNSSNSINIEEEDFDFMSFYEDLFYFILVLFEMKFCKEEINNNNIQEDNKNKIINNNNEQINMIRQDKTKLELINLMFYIEQTVSNHINNNNIQITTVYCLINLIKLFHIIIFDNKLISLFSEYKILVLFNNILESCKNSKIMYTNYYIKPYNKSSSILKTIPETIMDICIKLITSNITKKNNKNNYQEDILTNGMIIDILNEIYLNENINKKGNKKEKNENNKNKENDVKSLYCYNDIYRYLLSQKITNIDDETYKMNKNKIFKANFPKLVKEVKTVYKIYKYLNKEKTFNYNFITFNIEKIYKFLNNNSSPSNNKDLYNFLDRLLTKLIKEHEFLYNFNKDFFFKVNSNYKNYKLIKNKIEKLINDKKFDYVGMREYLDDIFVQKDKQKEDNIYELVTSGLCENIKEINKKIPKTELNKSFTKSFKSKEIFKRKNSINSHNDIKNDDFVISPPQYNDQSLSHSLKIENMENTNINKSRTSSISSSSELGLSQKEEVISQSDESSNNCIIINSPDSTKNNEILSSSYHLSSTTKSTNNRVHARSVSNFSSMTVMHSYSKFNITNSLFLNSNNNSNNKNNKNNLLEEINEINNLYYFNDLDPTYLSNVKRDLMKNIFSVNFIDIIFYDNNFIELKKLFIQTYGEKIEKLIKKSEYLNYPTKIKNFSNGIEPPLFVKPFNNFFDYKIFPITHNYFYKYIQKNEKKYKFKYINLFQKNLIIPEKERTFQYNCELIKIDHAIYGNLIYSKQSGYLYFEQEDYESIYNLNKNNLYYDGLFSLSSIKYKEKEYSHTQKIYKNKNSIPKYKSIIIYISEIEEIVERRFLLMWQGFEIYLKDGRSFYFHFLNEQKYEKFKRQLIKNNSELDQLIHKQDYLSKQKLITKAWEKNILTTYEYLLLINKYASRSFNDPNQYYVFPWLLTNFEDLIYINNNNNSIYEVRRKLSTSSNKETNNENNKKNEEIINFLRDLKYPVSLQNESNRKRAINRYNDDDDVAFRFHSGTHYSTAPFIYYYLMRQEPYNTLLIKLQNYQQENPNRMFIGIKETIDVLESGNDNRELIPEFFSKIEFMLNLNYSFYGYRSNNQLVNNVIIDFIKKSEFPYLISDYVHLIIEHKKLLNSNLISSNIHEWINNIFGIGQLPKDKDRKNACNVFRKSTYEKITDLNKKIKSYKKKLNEKNEKYTVSKIRTKIMNKINLIISFGQTPSQVFKDPHPKKTLLLRKESSNLGYNNKNSIEEEDDETDDLELFSKNVLRPNYNCCIIKYPCIYFEINKINNKIYGLTQNDEILEIQFENKSHSGILNLSFQNYFKIPHIKLFEKCKIKQDINYYIYKPKYAFCSFKSQENYENIIKKSSLISKQSSNIILDKNYNFNKYYKNLFENMMVQRNEFNNSSNEESYKFIQCRYLDNSFKLYRITKLQKSKKKEKEITIDSYSYICEDFVSSCCTISSKEFLIGLENGKLLRWVIDDEQTNKIKLHFNQNIQAHKGRINAIEIDDRLGLIITCGNDNYVHIRKLYNLELLTPIQIKKKYIITMAKVSPINFLYIMCFDKFKKQSVIFGYTLTGIKFAKSKTGYYCNIDFTHSGNIVSLFNCKEICVLNGYNLAKKDIKKNESYYKEYENVNKKIEGSIWLEFNYAITINDNDYSNHIVYIKKEKEDKENLRIYYYDFKGNEIFE